MSVRLSIIAAERCDHCGKLTAEVLYVFKFRTPEEGNAQLWLHKSCLQELTEKLWSMDAKQKRGAKCSQG